MEIGSSVHSVLRQLPGPSHCDCRAHPDYLRPLRGSLPLLLCQTWGRGVGMLESFLSFLEVSVSPCLVDLKAREERCNGIISLPRASKGTIKSLGKNIRWFDHLEEIIITRASFWSLPHLEDLIISFTELNSRPMNHHLITHPKSYPIM